MRFGPFHCLTLLAAENLPLGQRLADRCARRLGHKSTIVGADINTTRRSLLNYRSLFRQHFLPVRSVRNLALLVADARCHTPSCSLCIHSRIYEAVLDLDAIRFATHQELHNVALNYANVFQIQNDVADVLFAFKKFFQLGYHRFLDSAT